MAKQFKENIFFYVFIGFVLLVCLKIYYESENLNLRCIISDVDGNKYCVRDRVMIHESVDLLAQVTQRMKDLVEYMKNKYPDDKSVHKLVANFNPKKISETLPTSELTAYSENKGEKIAFCLNKTKNGSTLIDLNTLTFVAIHELSHLMTSSVGHKQDFWKNFKFLLENAKEIKIYNPVDYKKDNQSYCGMTITDNPLYDM
jgi:predicted metal-dependent hydrolase